MEIGEYYRTKKGLISIVKTINTPETRKQKHLGYTKRNVPLVNGRHTLDDIENHSEDIKELVKDGDFVNGMKVEMFYDTYNKRTGEYEDILGFPIYDDGLMNCITEVVPLTSIEIKSIVTKEQFSSLELIINTKTIKE